MSDTISTRFRLMIPEANGELRPCIDFLEEGLRAIKPTPYHSVLGRDFLKNVPEFSAWLTKFCKKAARNGLDLGALYVEMNGFTINPDQWHCDLFGYNEEGNKWDLDWLGDWDTESDACFVLHGMEPVQKAFAELFLDQNRPLSVRLAEEIAEHVVTARFMELVAAGRAAASQGYPLLKSVPLLATAHDWDVIHRTE